jgi:hypothetical protein
MPHAPGDNVETGSAPKGALEKWVGIGWRRHARRKKKKAASPPPSSHFVG